MRLPDFIVIGFVKCGTTTLSQWLDHHPRASVSDPKEPKFFSHNEIWSRGTEWYSRLFDAPDDVRVGEASTAYTHPDHNEIAATRILELLPQVRLVCIARHPLERLRSHYTASRIAGRERRSLLEAIGTHCNRYVQHSMYNTCLDPYLRLFPREQLCVVRSEDLDDNGSAWTTVLGHIGLADYPHPNERHNVTRELSQLGPIGRRLQRGRLRRLATAAPPPVRRVVAKVLTSRGGVEAALNESRAPIPSDVADRIWNDVQKLEVSLGLGPLWERLP